MRRVKRSCIVLGVMLLGLCSSLAFAADAKDVTVTNTTGHAASDVHVTFSGTGGAILIDNESVVVDPSGCPAPSIPSNNKTTNEATLDWGNNDCVKPGATVKFRPTTDFGPLGFVSGYWTSKTGDGREVGVAPLNKDDIVLKSAGSQGKTSAETQTGSDLVTDTFSGVVTDRTDRPATISAYRTDDLSATDSFSGTVTADGVDPARLEGLTYQIVQRTPSGSEQVVAEVPIAKGIFKGVLPAASAAATGSLFGRLTRNGQELARGTNIPLQPQPPRLHVPPTSAAVRIAEIQQANKPIGVLCSGVCDGNLETTSFKMGGEGIPLRAESPRKAVAAPSKLTGPITAEFQKKVGIQEVVATAQCRQVGVGITATSRTLRRGDHAKLNVAFTGLQGVQKPVPAELKNLTPQVVQLQGGNDQAFLISPQSMPADGVFTRSWTLTGVQPGEFDLRANVTRVYSVAAAGLNQVVPPCKDAVDLGIVATTTECPNGKVVFVDTHKWWCPPDGHTETSVVRTETDTPCTPVNSPHSTAGTPPTVNAPLGGAALAIANFKGKGGDGLKDSYSRGFADPNINLCKQQNCGPPQEITQGKDKGKIYCKDDNKCGGKECPQASCHVFYAWIDGARGPGGKDHKDDNEKWTLFGQDRGGIGNLTGIGKDNAIPRDPDHAYACACR